MPSKLQREETMGMPGGWDMEQPDASVPRMRTMQECVDYFALKDPETSIKYCTLRRWVLEGRVPFLQIGRMKLINLDLLIEIVSGRQAWLEPKKNLKILPEGRR